MEASGNYINGDQTINCNTIFDSLCEHMKKALYESAYKALGREEKKRSNNMW